MGGRNRYNRSRPTPIDPIIYPGEGGWNAAELDTLLTNYGVNQYRLCIQKLGLYPCLDMNDVAEIDKKFGMKGLLIRACEQIRDKTYG